MMGRLFRQLVAADIARLVSGPAMNVGPDQVAARWDSPPEPVRRYLRYTMPEGAPAIHAIRLKHDGFFRTKPGQRWFPIQGEEYFTAAQPAFMWHASIRIAPWLWVEARDRLLSGHGNMLVKFNSIIPIADASGPQIDQGSQMCWLAEAVWFPPAFASDLLRWAPVSSSSARAPLLRGGQPVSLVVATDEAGKLISLRGDRYRDVGGGSGSV